MAALRNLHLEIRVGNVESQIIGHVPKQLLDEKLNPLLPWNQSRGTVGSASGPALVFNPTKNTILTGALPRAKRVLREAGIRYRLRDFRSKGSRCASWQLQPGCVLREYQEEVVKLALERGFGLIDIGTGGGKTILAAAIIARLGIPTVFLVNTRTLLRQTVDNLRNYLGVEPGVIGEGIRKPSSLSVCLIQALPGVDLTPWRNGLCIIDEAHHACASQFIDTLRRLACRYYFLLSATPHRSGTDQIVLDALAGGEPLTRGRFSAQYLIEQGYAAPVKVQIEPCRIAGDMAEKRFSTLYREFIVQNRGRNGRVAEIAMTARDQGRSVCILVEHVAHGLEISRLLQDDFEFICGATPKKLLHQTTARFSAGEVPILIATATLFQEGTSIDRIHVVIHAGGLRSRRKVMQTIGRGMRKAPGKAHCLYVDFWDDDIAGIFRAHSRHRLRFLKSEGFHVPTMPSQRAMPESTEAIPPAWSHIPNTKHFVLVDSDGQLLQRTDCIEPDLVPVRFCRKCPERDDCSRSKKERSE